MNQNDGGGGCLHHLWIKHMGEYVYKEKVPSYVAILVRKLRLNSPLSESGCHRGVQLPNSRTGWETLSAI